MERGEQQPSRLCLGAGSLVCLVSTVNSQLLVVKPRGKPGWNSGYELKTVPYQGSTQGGRVLVHAADWHVLPCVAPPYGWEGRDPTALCCLQATSPWSTCRWSRCSCCSVTARGWASRLWGERRRGRVLAVPPVIHLCSLVCSVSLGRCLLCLYAQ